MMQDLLRQVISYISLNSEKSLKRVWKTTDIAIFAFQTIPLSGIKGNSVSLKTDLIAARIKVKDLLGCRELERAEFKICLKLKLVGSGNDVFKIPCQ